jgi:hypothetical protein
MGILVGARAMPEEYWGALLSFLGTVVAPGGRHEGRASMAIVPL